MTIKQKPVNLSSLNEETMINNINYTNNTNNTNNTNFTHCFPETKRETNTTTPAGASGLASLNSGEVICSVVGSPAQEHLPNTWRGLKIDLFQNSSTTSLKPNLKIKFGVIRHDGTTQSLVANLNSPNRYVWRKVSEDDKITDHWSLIADTQEFFEAQDVEYRCSKCTLPNKQGATELVAFLSETDTQWLVFLIRDAQRYEFWIDKNRNLTQSQKNGNIIASKFIGKETKKLLTAKDLDI